MRWLVRAWLSLSTFVGFVTTATSQVSFQIQWVVKTHLQHLMPLWTFRCLFWRFCHWKKWTELQASKEIRKQLAKQEQYEVDSHRGHRFESRWGFSGINFTALTCVHNCDDQSFLHWCVPVVFFWSVELYCWVVFLSQWEKNDLLLRNHVCFHHAYKCKCTSYLLGKTIPPDPIFIPKAFKSRNGDKDSTFSVNLFALVMFGK